MTCFDGALVRGAVMYWRPREGRPALDLPGRRAAAWSDTWFSSARRSAFSAARRTVCS